MARIRTIKPEFWTDEKVVTLTPLARLLFIGLWNFVDDFGRAPFSPARIKMQVLPADSADISELLGEIRREKLVTVYSVGSKEYFQIQNFEKHQKVDRRAKSKYPPPPKSAELLRNPPLEKEGKGKGKEKEKEEGRASAPAEIVFQGSYVKTVQEKDLSGWLARYSTLSRSEMLAEVALCDEYHSSSDSPPSRWFFTLSAWLKRAHDGRLKAKRDGDEAERRIYAGVL